MSTSAPESGASRLAGIQGLRAVAILLVVAYHAGLPIGAGFVGVDVFFVISGFVIARMLHRRADQQDGRIGLRWFWAGRVRRLTPALTLMVLITMVAAIPLTSPIASQTNLALSTIGAVTWTANAVLAVLTFGYFVPNAELNPLLHTWSLAVEEQFYLVFPAVVACCFAIGNRRARRRSVSGSARVPGTSLLTGVVAVSSVGSFIVCVALTTVGGGFLAFYLPFARVWEFGCGALVALVAARRPTRTGPVASVLGVAGMTLIVAGLAVISDPTQFPGWIVALPVVGATLLVQAVQADAATVRWLGARPLVRIGDVSYGWYLYHWPLLVLGRAFWDPGSSPWWVDVLAVGVAYGLAILSHRYVEEPIRHRRALATWSSPRLAVSLTAPVVGLCGLLLFVVAHSWWNPNVEAFEAGVTHDLWQVQQDCQNLDAITDRDLSDCTFPGTSDQAGFILVGDSNAGVYADALVAAGEDLHRTVQVASIPTCALSDLQPGLKGVGDVYLVDCRARYRDTMAWLAEQPPSVVLTVSGQNAIDDDDRILRGPDGATFTTRAEKVAAWREDQVRTYQRIEGMGHTVVPISIVPQFRDVRGQVWQPAACTFLTVLRDPLGCGRSMSRADMDRTQSGTLLAELGAAAATGVQHLDFRDEICRDDLCTTNRGDFWVYEDGGHLSYRMSLTLVPAFVRELPRLRTPSGDPSTPPPDLGVDEARHPHLLSDVARLVEAQRDDGAAPGATDDPGLVESTVALLDRAVRDVDDVARELVDGPVVDDVPPVDPGLDELVPELPHPLDAEAPTPPG